MKEHLFKFCEQELNFYWGNALRLGESSRRQYNLNEHNLLLSSSSYVSGFTHYLNRPMLSASGHYTSCPDDETEGQSGPGHPAMT